MITRFPVARLLVPLALALAAGAAAPALAQVQWRAADAPPLAMEKDAAGVLARVAGDGARHVALQLSRPVTDSDRAALALAGVRLGAPLGGNAYFASLDDATLDTRAPALAGLLAGAQAIDPRWKLHPAFAAGDDSAWTVVSEAAGDDGKPDPVVALYLLLHADIPNDAQAAAAVARHGGIVRDVVKTVNGLVIELPRSRAPLLAAEDIVQWLEPALPMLTPTNAENRTLTRANQVQAAPYNLSGAGVTAFVFDGGGVRTTHQDLAGRVTIIDASGFANHATHVAGTIAGTGAASGGNQRGMAPGATILSASLTTSSGFLYTNPGDIEADYGTAFGLGADLANNSIGTNVNNNGFPCSWHGDYGVTDGVIDAIVRGSPTVTGGQAFRVVWAAGNERGGRCDVAGGFRTIGPPAGAKNHLSVGAVNANNDTMTSFSGWGPTDDGRLKPDFCAPGCQSGGDGGVTSPGNSSNTAYSTLCGTSMASPTAAGICALILEDWRNITHGAPSPRNSTFKVLLAHSAEDLGNVGPDYRFGYGSIRADAAIDLLRSGAWAEGLLQQDFVHIYAVTVEPGSAPLVVTAAWDDPPGTPNVIPSLINDLDLRVYAPGGERHYPWTLDPAAPNAPAVRTAEDHLNNLEQVRIDAPVAGVWTIEIHATSIPVGPQPYSIVASNDTFAFAGSVSITIQPVALAPAFLDPGVSTPVSIFVDVNGDTIAPGSVQMHYRTADGPFTSVPMTDQGESVFAADLPPLTCGDAPDYYFTATGVLLGGTTLPAAGGAAPFSSIVGDMTVTFHDMETDAGWVGGLPGDTATLGQWERGIPQATSAQPGEDHTPDPGVNCWITGRLAGTGIGSFDVDGGFTTLLSPPFDLAAAASTSRIGYWRWYSNSAGAAPNTDIFTVDVSSDDGASWTNVEIVGPAGPQASGGWYYHEFRVADLVPLTDSIRLRFIASDLGSGSIVEAAIDDLSVFAITCSEPSCPADFNGNGTVEVPDIFAFLSAWFGGLPAADFDGNEVVNELDIFAFLPAWFAGCP